MFESLMSHGKGDHNNTYGFQLVNHNSLLIDQNLSHDNPLNGTHNISQGLDQMSQSHHHLSHSVEPTKWLPNEKSKMCFNCQKKFGLFRRKHHCRSCGLLVCGNCSPDKDYVTGYLDKRVRICKICLK